MDLGITDLMIPLLFGFYFWLALFHPSGLEASPVDSDLSAVTAVSMDPVGFPVISSCSGLWTNWRVVFLLWYFLNYVESTAFPLSCVQMK